MKKTFAFLSACLCLAAFGQQADLAVAGTPMSAEAERSGRPAYELVSFVATPMLGDGVRLQWSTGSEVPNSRFSVQRSRDRMNWATVITQDGEGDASGYSFYEVMDLDPLPGLAYYRLLAAADGRELEASDEFAVASAPIPELRIAGNNGPARFTVEGNGTITDLQVLNNRGQFVPMQFSYAGNQVAVHAESLEPGTYYVQATVDGHPVLRPLWVTATGVIGG